VQVSSWWRGQGGSAAANAEELANLSSWSWTSSKNQYETVQRGQQQQTSDQVDEALERLRQLAPAPGAGGGAAAAVAGRPPNMSGGGGGSQRALPRRRRTLARRLERLAREKSNPALSDTARRLQDAANAMRRSSAGGQGGSAAPPPPAGAVAGGAPAARRREKGGLDRQRAGRGARGGALAEAQRKVAATSTKELGAADAGQEGGRH